MNGRFLSGTMKLAILGFFALGACSSGTRTETPVKGSAGKGMDVKKETVASLDKKDKDYLLPGQIIACYFDCHLFAGEWGVAKLVTPASDKTRGRYEVEWLHNSHATAPGKKSWTGQVITKSHPAAKEELKTGMVVVYGAANKMNRGVIKNIVPGKDRVVIEWFHAPREKIYTSEVDIKAVRIIDEPVTRDPRKK